MKDPASEGRRARGFAGLSTMVSDVAGDVGKVAAEKATSEGRDLAPEAPQNPPGELAESSTRARWTSVRMTALLGLGVWALASASNFFERKEIPPPLPPSSVSIPAQKAAEPLPPVPEQTDTPA